MPDVETPPPRDPHTLELNIWKSLPSEELIHWVSEIMKAPLFTSKGVRPKKKKVPSSPPALIQEGHPEDELSPPYKLRSKFKQDNRPKKKPRS